MSARLGARLSCSTSGAEPALRPAWGMQVLAWTNQGPARIFLITPARTRPLRFWIKLEANRATPKSVTGEAAEGSGWRDPRVGRPKPVRSGARRQPRPGSPCGHRAGYPEPGRPDPARLLQRPPVEQGGGRMQGLALMLVELAENRVQPGDLPDAGSADHGPSGRGQLHDASPSVW
jgi:hypothetical protein